ncbi:MAG: hypothetical protein WC373_04610 [Smithella sp.]|jgi:hypothetical protein
MKDLKAIYKGDQKVRSGIVCRRTMGAYHNGRRLIVSLEPGDILSMREEKRQTRYEAGLGWVFLQLAHKYAAEQVEIAKKKREAKKRGLT